MNLKLLGLGMSVGVGLMVGRVPASSALPPPEEVPEEVLRTEIILKARSPINGELLTATEYAQLKAQIAERSTPTELDSRVQQAIFLLRLRKLFKTITPF
ncbi:MAG: hypothetical protein BRC44_00215 [Cyanobacteria bacterium QS_4_48_99]|nr:MAG: hypothetical protein BRC45_09325 [Cyanobacteria bacterium QS_5_48_63]PSO83424.1 MAG: hypothetical protein BRC44_00215 [Cyanobacteria bacterium QS_4_48_99]PSO84919.1 MAG: hypothetical protein BRC43_15115 [Cyanobacteria bacterium QS_3_48_167]PSO89726.1 MAG: hypothetical protein BRC46_15250 [Cyanobacteria bacterium QS_6_48_18]PSO91105.1 MAG: hypothetical protein BRC48_16240 [Cyanobacteria bacterium QS_9_48_30]PSP10967.1 MAG: hypothetical protein BRC49_08895 [Cyanobacteria bacterium SW_10_